VIVDAGKVATVGGVALAGVKRVNETMSGRRSRIDSKRDKKRLLFKYPPVTGLALTIDCHEAVYVDFDWDNTSDSSTKPVVAVNLSLDTGG
jgi:hypothetical protein